MASVGEETIVIGKTVFHYKVIEEFAKADGEVYRSERSLRCSVTPSSSIEIVICCLAEPDTLRISASQK